ncbi:ATP-binding protein [Methanothermobacter marburgensis]|uniref:ATP-binding protein n=1 Tax=Methanothermobacter marburgensis TaxID=145263 RepID=UPI0035B888B2
MEAAGQIIGGETAAVLIRQKSGEQVELGDLLVAEGDGYTILQVKDLKYRSQIPQGMRELASGFNLEGYSGDVEFLEPELRNYIIAEARPILHVRDGEPMLPKRLPGFFGEVRRIRDGDLDFLEKPRNPVFLGNVRSGSKVLETPVYIDAVDAITHHILIPATTGRGKSNLVKVMLWSLAEMDRVGMLVLDPHDEYYGRNEAGLGKHPSGNVVYYSPDAPVGGNTLAINLRTLRPEHFEGIIPFTQPQEQAIAKYHKMYGDGWIIRIVGGEAVENVDPRTLSVLRRVFDVILGVYLDEDTGEIKSRGGVFRETGGDSTIKDIVSQLEEGKIVVVDTSRLMGEAELLVGSVISGEIFRRYQKYKSTGELRRKPVIGIVIEEAPRVLGKEVIERQGNNIYSTIAREGRKFNIGLVAITQLVSLIPRTVLANMNTKIILGNEMAQERAEIIGSASQDLSDDSRTIASLDKGEAIVSSIFTKFAVPVKIPLFEEFTESMDYEDDEGDIEFIG